jgi:hypothetical protein
MIAIIVSHGGHRNEVSAELEATGFVIWEKAAIGILFFASLAEKIQLDEETAQD